MIFLRNFVFRMISIPALMLLKKNKTNSKSLLLVELSNPLGDFVSRIEFINSVALNGFYTKIYFVVDKKFKGICHLLNLDFTIIFIDPFQYKINPFYKYNILKRLNKLELDLVVNLSVNRGMLNDEISIYSGAKTIIASQLKSDYLHRTFLKRNNARYTQLCEMKTQNEYDKLEELKSIFIQKYNIKFQNTLVTKKEVKSKNYIVVAPFASKVEQSWPLINYIDLINRLSEQYNIVIVGNNNYRKKELLLLKKHSVNNLISKTSLNEVNEYIKNAFLFIGNDSGLTHLALLHKIPIVGVIGGGNYGQFFPVSYVQKNIFLFYSLDCFNCKWKCKYNEALCITKVTVEQVYLAAHELLKDI